MAKDKYTLQTSEYILLKSNNVRHGFWNSYTDELVLTNLFVIHVKRGLFGNYKGTDKYSLEEIKQAVVGEAQNGEKQLEIYTLTGMEAFAIQSGNIRELKTWAMAIEDQITNNTGRVYSTNYYSRFLDEDDPDEGTSFADQLGITELSDELEEVKNEFRVALGFKPKQTRAQKKEEELNKEYDQKVKDAKRDRQIKSLSEAVSAMSSLASNNSNDLDSQLEKIEKLKQLYDQGALTEEEFTKMKKQILRL